MYVVADIREVTDFGDERTIAHDQDTGSRSEPEASPRADPFRGEFSVSETIDYTDSPGKDLLKASQSRGQ